MLTMSYVGIFGIWKGDISIKDLEVTEIALDIYLNEAERKKVDSWRFRVVASKRRSAASRQLARLQDAGLWNSGW